MVVKPTTEAEMLDLLMSRNGRPTRVIAMDGESMKVQNVCQASEHGAAVEFVYYAERGGIPVCADDGRYFFYTNEVARIEDIASGEVIYDRGAN